MEEFEFTLQRTINAPEETVGEINNLVPNRIIYTLEDEYHQVKIKGDTRIPAGRYEVVFRTEGRHHEQYLQKCDDTWHKGMLMLKDVPNFQYILIHIGNTENDTEGCLLVGLACIQENNHYVLKYSTAAYLAIYPIIRDELLKGKKVFINIKD